MKAPDFAGASKEVLSFLRQRMGMDLWMVTRADDGDSVVLQSEDHGYGIHPGDTLRWADSYCARMVRGEGPRVAPRVADVPAYAELAAGGALPVGAYVGVPLVDGQGQLFGTLCGLNPRPMPSAILEDQPMVEVLADMLSGLLSAELSTSALAREAEAARSEALSDAVTGLANRRGWETALAAEEERCRRYGAIACVVALEFDGMGSPPLTREQHDATLARAAQALRQTVRKPDTLARLDGACFVVLGVECTTAEAMPLLRRLEQGVQGAGLSAALGMAMRNRSTGLNDTFERALDAMVEHRDARARD